MSTFEPKNLLNVVREIIGLKHYSYRSHFSSIPKGHNLPHSGLTTAYDRTNHSQFAPPYPRTHDYGSVQSNAPTREPPHTLSSLAVASPLANENINLTCVRRNPSDSLNLVLARNGEKLRADRQQQQFVYLKSTISRVFSFNLRPLFWGFILKYDFK